MVELLIKCSKFIVNYLEHDSLLENLEEEQLTEEECRTAWLREKMNRSSDTKRKLKVDSCSMTAH